MTFSIYRIRLVILTVIITFTAFLSFSVKAGVAKEIRTASGKRISYPDPKPRKKIEPNYDKKVHEKIKSVMTHYKTRLNESQKDQISQHILKQSKKYGYDPLFLTALIITESSFNHRAKSRVGALGLMQIRPRTGKALASETNIRWRGKHTLYHPEKNIALGSFYLNKLIKRFGNLNTALEAYNHGPTRMSRFLRKGWHPIKYSRKVFSIYNEIRKPENSPEFTSGPILSSGNMITTFRGDTLWRLAKRLGFNSREATLVSVALWLDNQEAFINGNLHRIEPDRKINLDKLDYRLATLDRRHAYQIAQNQWKEWKRGESASVQVRTAKIESTKSYGNPFAESPAPSEKHKVVLIATDRVQLQKTHELIFPGDSLWKISQRLGYASRDASRVAVALWLDNMDAFINANIHRIKAGERLNLKNLDRRLETLDYKTASRIVKNQWQEWKNIGKENRFNA